MLYDTFNHIYLLPSLKAIENLFHFVIKIDFQGKDAL